ncbi:unnamed protein product [Diamesa tonsa]
MPRPVCKKAKFSIADKTVISRSCSWEYADEKPNKCMQPKMANAEMTFCETCQHDGCNRANALSTPSLVALIFIALFKIQFLNFDKLII